MWAEFIKQRGINLNTSTYWNVSYFQKITVLWFLSLIHNLTMSFEQSADRIFFLCKFVACWNAQRFHTVCEKHAAGEIALQRSSEWLDESRISDVSFHMGFLCTCPPCCEFSQPSWLSAYWVSLLCWQLQHKAQLKFNAMILIVVCCERT